MSAHCQFCKLGESGNISEPHNDVIARSDQYFGMASLGAFLPNWVLVSPTAHCVNLATHFHEPQFWKFCDQVHTTLLDMRPSHENIAIFEHGPSEAGSVTGCGVDHAHLHFLPIDFSLENASQAFNDSWHWENISASEVNEFAGGHEYLFVSDSYDSNATRGNIHLLDKPISQFFRQVIAKQIGSFTYFNYRRYPFETEAAKTALRFKVRAHNDNQQSAVLLKAG